MADETDPTQQALRETDPNAPVLGKVTKEEKGDSLKTALAAYRTVVVNVNDI